MPRFCNARSGKKRQDALRGFTLIELITVIIILGILSAVILPRFINLGSVDRLMEYENLKSQIAYARTNAMATGCYSSIDIELASASLVRDADCNQTNGWCFTSAISEPYQNQAYIRNYASALNPDSIRLVFSPAGQFYSSTNLANCIGSNDLNQNAGTFSIFIEDRLIRVDYQTGLLQ